MLPASAMVWPRQCGESSSFSLGAARRIVWLHVVGLVFTVIQMGSGILFLLQVIKILIHIFGGVTAFLAQRARV